MGPKVFKIYNKILKLIELLQSSSEIRACDPGLSIFIELGPGHSSFFKLPKFNWIRPWQLQLLGFFKLMPRANWASNSSAMTAWASSSSQPWRLELRQVWPWLLEPRWARKPNSSIMKFFACFSIETWQIFCIVLGIMLSFAYVSTITMGSVQYFMATNSLDRFLLTGIYMLRLFQWIFICFSIINWVIFSFVLQSTIAFGWLWIW